ncbi:MAG: hypothetical protein GC157_04635 [Frankiales bacterium]|nr:hypothetical protein [Frankiales bacterium]
MTTTKPETTRKPKRRQREVAPAPIPPIFEAVPEWASPYGSDERADLLFCLAIGDEQGLAQHLAVGEARQALRGYVAERKAAEQAVLDAQADWQRGFETRDTGRLVAAALARDEAARRAQALAYLPAAMGIDVASTDDREALSRGVKARSDLRSFWASAVLEYDFGLSEEDEAALTLVARRWQSLADQAVMAAKALEPGGQGDLHEHVGVACRRTIAQHAKAQTAHLAALGMSAA